MSLTFAIAKNAPVGVVIECYTSKLSRMHRWDLETDTFTPGQFLKGKATVQDISPDGRYVVYYVVIYHRGWSTYVGVAHIPFFTAVAFSDHYTYTGHTAIFRGDGNLIIEDRFDPGFAGRIEPGCPFEIISGQLPSDLIPTDKVLDGPRKRWIAVDRNSLVATDQATGVPKLIRALHKEPFEEVVPPEWVKRW